MDDKMYIGITEIEKWQLIFSPFSDDDSCKKMVGRLAEFIGDSQQVALEGVQHAVGVVIQGVGQKNGQLIATAHVAKIEKLSKWTFLDHICYKLWFPWGIRQKYFVETTDRKRYVITFGGQSQGTFRLIEAALHEEEMKLKRGFV